MVNLLACINENKSEAIVIHSPSLRTPITFSRINICGQFVDTSAVIRDLGFAIDTHLSMASQVSNICRSAYYHLARIAKIRDSLTTSVCKSLIHGLVKSRLDYGNAMLFLITDRLLHGLEMVQRSVARIVMQIRRGDRQSMTTILGQLHWLPIKRRIEYKILDQSTLPHCCTSTHQDAAYALPAGYFSTCHEST